MAVQNRPIGRVVAIGVAVAMSCAALVVPTMAQAQSEARTSAKKDVQVIAFQQSWNTIAKECTDTYGPEGVAYVEVSPPQESIQGTQWWTSYQPVSYRLDSKLGTEAEFKNMIKQCNAAGVDIIADVVINQTTGSDVAAGEQKGVAGSDYNGSTGSYPGFATKQYPDGITASDFHSCTKNISDYGNQWGFQLRKREGAGHPVRLPGIAVECRRARVPDGCRQAHQYQQHEGDQGEVRAEDRQECG